MSSVPMDPEISTASMRSRPVTGTWSGSPVHWGRMAATTRQIQIADMKCQQAILTCTVYLLAKVRVPPQVINIYCHTDVMTTSKMDGLFGGPPQPAIVTGPRGGPQTGRPGRGADPEPGPPDPAPSATHAPC